MENSAKALLMAGGVLVTMLIVTLLFYFKGKITEYYNDQGKIDDIANVADFNKQFTNYERDKVYGYEIISLANMVEDYNTRHSGADNAPNDEKYTPFTLVVSFEGKGNDVEQKIWYNTEGGINHLFNSNNDVLTQSETSNQVVDRILKATEIEDLYGVSETTKLAKSINKLIVKEDPINIDYQVQKLMNEQKVSYDKAILILKRKAIADFRAIIKDKDPVPYESSEVNSLYNDMKNLLLYGKYQMSIRQYYEYYQFKKAIFECDKEKILYDNGVGGTGRIIGMTFKFTGKVE